MVFFAAAVGHGDVVKLKSGGIIEGIITRVHNGVVCMNVGFGTTFVDSIDILSVTRSDAQKNKALFKEWNDQGTMKSASANPVLLAFIDRLRGLRALRSEAISRQRELERLDADIDSLERAFSSNAENYQAMSPELGTLSEKEMEEQYRLVGQAHLYNSSIIGLRKQIEEKNEDLRRGNPALPEYLDSVAIADQAFRAFRKNCPKKILCDNQAVLRGIEDDFKRYKSEFKTAVTDATFIQGDHIVVQVCINGRAPVLLLLDTGASVVTLSRALADRLGINWNGGMKVSAIMADGRTSEGYSVLLKSVTVGDFRAANVRAVVMEEPPVKGIEGLLGMSYLQRFIIRIDPANKKFVLQRIVAR
jgi:clan AA aspartic protease (TIGR02281 family)